ncbi:MAG: tyrosine-type recombinase/integrase [Proteobacteria bacterium]|nr:tyrosine-type recombinase/integrase [Pseudomonadota bacterium]MBU1389705.1 tyrosine-type recombinase/integrase [Pseudomonadota bacterium]MBU1542643.1 tyrosine-type recombinase/integrase [Pseudomonadota bacterium]MBU2479529.1 tyrosine-type recombinase/integrase [Pseudomonadota bacterium]
MKRTGLKKGSKITAEPIRKQKDIKAIGRLLKSRPRDFLLWTLGVNNGLRSKDLVRLRYSQVEGLKPGAVIKIVESKTGKDNVLVINNSVHKALQHYIKEINPAPDDYLFSSRKGKGHISSQSVGRMIRSWAEAINLKGQYGAHTLRKTFGYHQRVTFGAGFEILCKRYNHSSPVVTMRYLGIEDKEIHELLMNEVG